MHQRIAIVGVGYTPFRPTSPEVSYREIIFEAATAAYADAGITPGDVDTFVQGHREWDPSKQVPLDMDIGFVYDSKQNRIPSSTLTTE